MSMCESRHGLGAQRRHDEELFWIGMCMHANVCTVYWKMQISPVAEVDWRVSKERRLLATEWLPGAQAMLALCAQNLDMRFF